MWMIIETSDTSNDCKAATGKTQANRYENICMLHPLITRMSLMLPIDAKPVSRKNIAITCNQSFRRVINYTRPLVVMSAMLIGCSSGKRSRFL